MLNEDFRNQNYVLGQRSFRNDKTETNNKRGHDCKPMDLFSRESPIANFNVDRDVIGDRDYNDINNSIVT